MGINIGLDIGIASVGLAVVDSDTGNVLETVADLFNCAEVSENVKRREFRQARRLKRRQHTRLEDFKKLWGAEGFIIPKNINLYSLELKVRALQEKITMDELYVVLYNSLKHRGISYLDDFEESTEGGSEYQKGIQINQQELETKYPCQIQLERFKKYGAYRGQIIVEENGDKTVLSNVYAFSAYKKEIDTILEAQSKYYPELTNDFIEKYLRVTDSEKTQRLTIEFNRILEEEVAPYRILNGLVVPIIGKSELNSIGETIDLEYESVSKHMTKALELYSDRKKPDYENSVKESISSVESMCSIITGLSGGAATLGNTLKKLKENGVNIHPALENAFKQLYGYTSDLG